jgi:hypothetical protein
MAEKTTDIGLVDFLDSLRREIFDAMTRSPKERLQFQANKIDLELQISAEKSGGPDGKVEFKVLGSGLSLGGGAKFGKKTVHTVKLSLTPMLDGKPVTPFIQSNPGEWKG